MMVEKKIKRVAEQLPWWQRETVRLRGYSVSLAIVGILVLREYLSNEEAAYVLMAIAAVLGVYGIESSRSSTTADVIVHDAVGQAERRTRWPNRAADPADCTDNWPYRDDGPEDYPDDWQDDDVTKDWPKH